MFLADQQEYVGTNEGSWHTRAGPKPGRQGAPHTFSTPPPSGWAPLNLLRVPSPLSMRHGAHIGLTATKSSCRTSEVSVADS